MLMHVWDTSGPGVRIRDRSENLEGERSDYDAAGEGARDLLKSTADVLLVSELVQACCASVLLAISALESVPRPIARLCFVSLETLGDSVAHRSSIHTVFTPYSLPLSGPHPSIDHFTRLPDTTLQNMVSQRAPERKQS